MEKCHLFLGVCVYSRNNANFDRIYGNVYRMKYIARFILKLCGWTIHGELPADKKAVVISVPHTSIMDFVCRVLWIIVLLNLMNLFLKLIRQYMYQQLQEIMNSI